MLQINATVQEVRDTLGSRTSEGLQLADGAPVGEYNKTVIVLDYTGQAIIATLEGNAGVYTFQFNAGTIVFTRIDLAPVTGGWIEMQAEPIVTPGAKIMLLSSYNFLFAPGAGSIPALILDNTDANDMLVAGNFPVGTRGLIVTIYELVV